MRTTITILSLALAITLSGCDTKKPIEQPPQGVQAQRIEGVSSTGSSEMRFSAVVTPDSEVQLGFRIPGYVVSLMQVRGADGRMRDLNEGDRVNRGAVLVRIRANEYDEKVRQAKSQTEAAEAAEQKAQFDFNRATTLFNSQSLTKPDYDSAKAQYDSAQAEVRAAHAATSEAQIALRDTSLVAPFSGEIVKKAVELGSFVGPGVTVFAVANTEVVKIVIGVPDTTVRSIKLRQPVDVDVDAFPGRTFHAQISRISSAADPKTRSFEVEVAIPNREHLLKAGMIASLQLSSTGNEMHESSLLVPLPSVVQSPDGKYGVFLVSDSPAGAIARLRNVELGGVQGSDIRIVSGVSAGESVITQGAALLKDGQRVEVLK
jgi:RND family efflux transporter MFP subunit